MVRLILAMGTLERGYERHCIESGSGSAWALGVAHLERGLITAPMVLATKSLGRWRRSLYTTSADVY